MNTKRPITIQIHSLITVMRYNMAMMIRPKGKPKKIAYKILGIPSNMQNRDKKQDNQIRRRLTFEETARVK